MSTYQDLDLAPRKSVRDIKSANARTQLYARLLQRVHGVSAAEMKAAVHAAFPEVAHLGFTPHNSYSLQLLSNTFGFRFLSIAYIDEGKLSGTRYFFRSEKNAAKFDAAHNDQLRMIKAAAKPAKASRSVRMPLASNPQAKEAKRVAKASSASQGVSSAANAKA